MTDAERAVVRRALTAPGVEKRRRLKLEAQSAVGVPDLEAFSAHGLARRRQQLEGTIFGLRQAKNCTRALRLALENEKPDDRWGLRKRQNPKTKKRSSGRPLPTYRPRCSGLTYRVGVIKGNGPDYPCVRSTPLLRLL